MHICMHTYKLCSTVLPFNIPLQQLRQLSSAETLRGSAALQIAQQTDAEFSAATSTDTLYPSSLSAVAYRPHTAGRRP